MRCTLHFQ